MSKHSIITESVFFTSLSHKAPPVSVTPRPFSSLSFRKSGKISVTAGGKRLLSCKDTLTFIPRGCGYVTEVLEEGEMDIVHFCTSDAPPLSDAPLVLSPESPLLFRNLFERAVRAFAAEGCDFFSMAYVYKLLAETNTLLSGNRPLPHGRMIKCKQYLDERIGDPTLRICQLAELSGVSEAYFRREFRKFYGTSPLSYLKRKRIELSCHLLSCGLYSITEVALSSGFESISYFSAEFRRAMGCTPLEYARRVAIAEE